MGILIEILSSLGALFLFQPEISALTLEVVVEVCQVFPLEVATNKFL